MTNDTETANTAEAQAAPKNPRRHARIYALLALLAFSQMGLAGYVWQLTVRSAPASAAAQATEIEALKAALNAQHEQLAQLQTQLGSGQAPSSSADAIERFNLQQQSLSELQGRIEALEQAEPAATASANVASVSLEEISKAGKEMRQLKAQIEAEYAARLQDIQLLTAFDRLQERVFAEETYDQAFAAFRVASEALPASKEWFAILKPLQHEGVASWDQLQSQFESARSAAAEAQVPAAPAPKNEATQQPSAQERAASMWRSVRANLSSLITIRKTGNSHQGSDLESVLARAAFALQQQDAQGVIAELEALPAEQRALFAEFEASLQSRQNLFALMHDIRLYLQARLQQPNADN